MRLEPVRQQLFTRIDEVVAWQENDWSTWLSDMYGSFRDNITLAFTTITAKIKLDLVDFKLKDIFSGVFGNAFGFAGGETINLFLRHTFKTTDTDPYLNKFENDHFVVVDKYSHVSGSDGIQLNQEEIDQLIQKHPNKNIILPVSVEHHMTTVYIDQDKKRIYYYDPQGFQIKEPVKEALTIEGFTLGTLTGPGQIVPHDQQNRTDCGVICIKFMEHLLSERDPLPTPENFNPTFQSDSSSRIKERVRINTLLQDVAETKDAQKKRLEEDSKGLTGDEFKVDDDDDDFFADDASSSLKFDDDDDEFFAADSSPPKSGVADANQGSSSPSQSLDTVASSVDSFETSPEEEEVNYNNLIQTLKTQHNLTNKNDPEIFESDHFQVVTRCLHEPKYFHRLNYSQYTKKTFIPIMTDKKELACIYYDPSTKKPELLKFPNIDLDEAAGLLYEKIEEKLNEMDIKPTSTKPRRDDDEIFEMDL